MHIQPNHVYALLEINTDDDCYWNGESFIRVKVTGCSEDEIFQKMRDYLSRADICISYDEHKAMEMRGYVTEAIAAIDKKQFDFQRGGNRTIEYCFCNREYDIIL